MVYTGTLEPDFQKILSLKLGPVSQKILSPLVIFSMEKTMVTMVISELKSISRLKVFSKNWTLILNMLKTRSLLVLSWFLDFR